MGVRQATKKPRPRMTQRGLRGTRFLYQHQPRAVKTRRVTKGKPHVLETSISGTLATQHNQGQLDRFGRTISVIDSVATNVTNCPIEVEWKMPIQLHQPGTRSS